MATVSRDKLKQACDTLKEQIPVNSKEPIYIE